MNKNAEQVLVEWLVLGAQGGDADALEQLLTLFYPRMLRLASRLLGDNEAARDVTQLAMESLVRELRRMRDPKAFRSWAYRILHHKTMDHLRRTVRQRNHERAPALKSQAAGVTEDNSVDAITAERLLSQLPPEMYQIVHLHYLEGLRLREIAAILQIPEGTAKSRLFHARELLRRLAETNNEDRAAR